VNNMGTEHSEPSTQKQGIIKNTDKQLKT